MTAAPTVRTFRRKSPRLRLIVDDLDDGIVVLDRERRVQFVNSAFRRFWKIPDGLAESQPSFVKLMYHGRGVETYAVSHDRLGDYVAQQLALIRSGEERPLSIELRDRQSVSSSAAARCPTAAGC